MSDDTMTEAGAKALARKIRAYYAARGVKASVRVDRKTFADEHDRHGKFFCVRSNIKLDARAL